MKETATSTKPIPRFIAAMSYTAAEKRELARAYRFARDHHRGQVRKSGEPYISHPAAVALVLAEWQVDIPTIQAGLLHDVLEDTDCTLPELTAAFGKTCADLVDAVTKIGSLQEQVINPQNPDSLENLRKLLIAMSEDIRVILVKLADRLHNMRTLQHLDAARQVRKSRETLEIYAPIADRLGMGDVKAELEDLAFRYSQPQEYKYVAELVAPYIRSGKKLLDEVIPEITQDCNNEGLTFSVTNRIKHVFSIYKKLTKYDQDVTKIRDLVALRVIVPDVASCYHVLGFVHQRYKPLPRYIKDYIAVPKPNGYQSLHTTVLGKQHIFEVQIRTQQMHDFAERGLAAHFHYDASKTTEQYQRGGGFALPKKYEWVKSLLDWHEHFSAENEARTALRLDVFSQRIFVFSPKGDLYDLPEGATSVDFAFAIHTDLGLGCRGAKVNGRIVPLDSTLQNRDVVEIFAFVKSPKPSRDWLSFVVTAKARSRIKAWLRDQERSTEEQGGRSVLEATLRQLNGRSWDQMAPRLQQSILESLHLDSYSQLAEALYEGRVHVADIRRVMKFMHDSQRSRLLPRRLVRRRGARPAALVPGVEREHITRAGCCSPVYPESIIGFVSRNGQLRIHRPECRHIQSQKIRCLPAYWYFDSSERIKLVAQTSQAMSVLQSISSILHIHDARAQDILENEQGEETQFDIKLSLVRMDKLSDLLNALKRVGGVVKVEHLIRTE